MPSKPAAVMAVASAVAVPPVATPAMAEMTSRFMKRAKVKSSSEHGRRATQTLASRVPVGMT